MIYYFIGIKGSGMSSLACIMHDLGYTVMGSDKPDHFFTEEQLLERNIKIFEFNENNIKEGMIIVQGNAFTIENVEVKRANDLHLKIYTYQEMIAKITDDTKLIAISGCHGKTSTTTMFKNVFAPFGINYLIGDGTGFANKDNNYFALEACEYKRHFLSYNPYYAIITNIELDHTDYYKDLDDVIDAFNEFANKARNTVIMCGDDINTKKIKTDKKVLSIPIRNLIEIDKFTIWYQDKYELINMLNNILDLNIINTSKLDAAVIKNGKALKNPKPKPKLAATAVILANVPPGLLNISEIDNPFP